MDAMAKNNLRRNGWTKYCSNLKMSSLEQFNNKNNFKRYVCSFCGFRTHKKYNLDVHKKNKHPDPNVHPYQNHENQPIPQHWLIAQHPH